MSGSLQPQELQHARSPCPSPAPLFYPNSCPSVSDAIQLLHPLWSPSPPALNLSEHQGLCKWVSSSHQVAKFGISASTSVLPMNTQHWYPLEYQLDLIWWNLIWLDLLEDQGTFKSLLQDDGSKASILWQLAFFTVQLSQFIHDQWKNHSFE